jgi:hypothetical protein
MIANADDAACVGAVSALGLTDCYDENPGHFCNVLGFACSAQVSFGDAFRCIFPFALDNLSAQAALDRRMPRYIVNCFLECNESAEVRFVSALVDRALGANGYGWEGWNWISALSPTLEAAWVEYESLFLSLLPVQSAAA